MLLQPKHLTRRPMVMALSDADVIGDPFGGPASGSREKSKGLGKVIGVVAAVMTAGAGWGMYAATNATFATQLAGGAMMAGGVMSGVGTVTGNAKLAKMGGILSLAGGLGSGLADSLGHGINGAGGSFGDSLRQGASDFGTMFKDTVGLGNAATKAPVSDGTISAVEGVTDATSGAAPGVAEAATIPVVDPANGAGGLIRTTGQQATNPIMSQSDMLRDGGSFSSGQFGGGMDMSAYPPLSEGSSGSQGYFGGGFSRGAASLPGAAESASSGGLLSQASGWLKDNQLLASMGMQVGGGLLGGAGQSELLEAQLQAKKDTEMWAQGQVEQQKQNINGGVVFLDPTSPNYATAAANAQAAGRTVKTIGVNQNAGPVQLNNGFQMTSTPQQQATQRA